MVQCATPWTDQSCCPEDLAAAFLWQGAWVASRVYAVNAAVAHDGSTWLCVKSHVSVARPATGANEPPDNPSAEPTSPEWELMTLGGSVISWKGPWDSLVSYVLNDAVQYAGSAYIALQASLDVIPTDDPLSWDLIVAGQVGTSSGYPQFFDVSETDTTTDPGDRAFTLDSESNPTEIATDDLNTSGISIAAWIANFAGGTTPGDLGQLTLKNDEFPDTIWKRLLLTGVIVSSGFTRLGVTLVDSAGVFPTSETFSFEFARTGNKGTDGLGAGDVVGPSSVDDDNLTAFDTTTGKLIKEVALTGTQAVADSAKVATIASGAEVNLVDSVNGDTGDVVLDTDDIADTAANRYTNDTDITRLAGVEADANDYTHPNHSGDVTSSGDGATTIINNAVTTLKILNSAVTTAKILDLNVTEGKLADNAVTLAKMAGGVAGDIYFIDGSGNPQRLPKGADGEFLQIGAVIPTWAVPAGSGDASVGSVQTWTAGQRKQVTDKAVWTTAWNIDESNDFDIQAALTSGNDGEFFPTPDITSLENGAAQAGEITFSVSATHTATFAVAWTNPDGVSGGPLDITAVGDYTLYYRVWKNSGGTEFFRITSLALWG